MTILSEKLILLSAYPFDSDDAGYDAQGYPVYDRAVDASWMREAIRRVFSNGVFGNDGPEFLLGAGEGRSITVNPGICVIDGAVGGWRGDPRVLTIDKTPVGDVTYTVMLRFDNNIEYRSIFLRLVEGGIGTYGPEPPEIGPSVTELRLGYVTLPSGATDMSGATIVNEKGREVCPYAAPFVDIDLSEVIHDAQTRAEAANADFTAYLLRNMELIASALDGTAAGHLQAEIDRLRAESVTSDGLDPRNLEIASDTPTGTPLLRISEGFADGELARIDPDTRQLSLDPQSIRRAMGLGDSTEPISYDNIAPAPFTTVKLATVTNAYAHMGIRDLYEPNAVEIGQQAFYLSNLSSPLRSVDAPMCESVGMDAFSKCAYLTDVSLPACVTVGVRAFDNCSSLASASLPSLELAGSWAFQSCTSLRDLSLPMLAEVGEGAFQQCSSLKEVRLPSLMYAGGNAFYSCISLESIDLPMYTGHTSSSGTADSRMTFGGCRSLRSVNLPGMDEVGISTFTTCLKLERIALPAASRILSSAFYNCVELRAIDMPECISLWGSSFFYSCDALSVVSFPAMTSGPESAYYGGAYNVRRAYFRDLPSARLITGSRKLDALILSGSFCAATSTSVVSGMTSLGCVYVPASLVETYRSATNWVTMSSRVLSLDELPDLEVVEASTSRVAMGEVATVRCTVSGLREGVEVSAYKWYYREENSPAFRVVGGQDAEQNLAVNVVDGTLTRRYRCEVSLTDGTVVYTNAVSLDVEVAA